MKKIAHIENNKIVNISLHEKAPKGKQYLDVTDSNADIGDEVLKGQIVSQHAIKDLEAARSVHLHQINNDLSHQHNIVQESGFKISSLPELWSTFELMEQVVSIRNDRNEMVILKRDAFLNAIKALFQHKQALNKVHMIELQKNNNAKSVAELLPAHMVHPEAK